MLAEGSPQLKITAQKLAEHLGAVLHGQVDALLYDVAPLDEAAAGQVTYVESAKQVRMLKGAVPGAVIAPSAVADQFSESGFTWLIVDHPQQAFIGTMLLFRPPVARATTGISQEACISQSAKIGEGTNIYPGACIGENVVIGRNCDVFPGAVVRERVTIGNDCVIHPNAVLYPRVQLANRVIVHANAVIGADGFGYRFADGRFERLPHTGTVIIQDDVEIGACATVDRAMIGATVIGSGTKIDNLVMIAHNCRIGRHNAFASQVGFAGSCTTGDYVRCGGQVGIADHVHIGSGVSLGGKAGVMNDLPDGGTYHGIPARLEKEAIKHHLTLLRVPEMRDQIQQLAAQLEELKNQLESKSRSTPLQVRAA